MFAQSFVDARVQPNRGWSVVMSLFFQMAAVMLLIAVPLLKPEVLPRAVANFVTITPPPAAAPPPAPAPKPSAHALPAAQTSNGRLFEPVSIPNRVAVIEDPDLPSAGTGEGVQMGSAMGIQGASNSLVNSFAAIRPPAPTPPPPAHVETLSPETPRIVVGGNVQEALLTHKVIPVYPKIAVQARVEGTVRFSAIVSKAGAVTNLTLLSGHALLVEAAADAVRQWRYRPTYLNGDPVEVITTIEVRFTLARR